MLAGLETYWPDVSFPVYAANAILAAAGYNFRRLLAWLDKLWHVFITAWLAARSDYHVHAHATA
jgi:hypothetical protein